MGKTYKKNSEDFKRYGNKDFWKKQRQSRHKRELSEDKYRKDEKKQKDNEEWERLS